MSRRIRIQRQPRVEGGRISVHSGVIREIEAAIATTQRRFLVSRSFIIHVALAEYFGIAVSGWDDPKAKRRRKG